MRDDVLHSGAGQDRDDLDILLDAALASYVDAESSPALMQRILATTGRASNRPKLLRWLAWSIPALAALLLLAIFLGHHSAVPHEKSLVAINQTLSAPPISRAPVAVAPVAAQRSLHPPQRPARTIRVTEGARQPLPRLEVFPTPMSLTPEEQALAALVNRNPDIRRSVISGQKPAVEPLSIAAIQIPPLNPPDRGGN